MAGPFGTQVLADLGANVIKVNATRDPWWHATHIAYGANRGKRSICIDLKTTEGLAVLHRLVEKADVVHSNMRRDALRRLGCDEASLREVNPDIIYCHTRGFDRGPRSDSPGNDQTGCSLAGVTFEDGGCRDGGKPFWSLTSLGDTGNGFLSAIGVIQALYHRTLTGEAQSVDTSILNAGLLVASMASVKTDGEAWPVRTWTGCSWDSTPSTASTRRPTDGCAWPPSATTTGPDARRPRTGPSPKTLDSLTPRPGRPPRTSCRPSSNPSFRERSVRDLFEALDGRGVPCEIADPDFSARVFDDPEMQSRGLVVQQQHPKLGRFDHFGATITFSDTPGAHLGPASGGRGAHPGDHPRARLRHGGNREAAGGPTRCSRTCGSTDQDSPLMEGTKVLRDCTLR